MTNLETRQQQFVDDLNTFDAWNDKFNYLISIGEELKPMPAHLMIPENLVLGCVSKTYFNCHLVGNIIRVYGWSNACTVSGIIAALVTIFDGLTVDELQGATINFHITSELLFHLTPSRHDALLQMINRITALTT